ncbi:MAG: CoA-binding protein [Flavobacteriales bacterium]|nr:CoA-binding protein [Flavobacteriales bacterium]MCB9363766.1 CoA-binding protein [Flavobacteriales bacterium]
MKRTLVLGASTKPERYAYKATVMLAEHNHPVFPVGLKAGEIESHQILVNTPIIENIDTVTLYLGPQNQPMYYDYIVNQIKPKRIIFNPGTENPELQKLAQEKGIETEIACTLVLLSTNQY